MAPMKRQPVLRWATRSPSRLSTANALPPSCASSTKPATCSAALSARAVARVARVQRDGYSPLRSECSAAWLAHQTGGLGVGGSNPPTPTSNFKQFFMQRMKDEPPPPPDVTWFQRLVALAILYRAVERTIRAAKFPAYGAQIVAYVVAGLSHRVGGRLDFARVWSKQAASPEFESLIGSWAVEMDRAMRQSAGQRNPSE